MPNPALARQVRATLECTPDSLSVHDLLTAIDEFVLECAGSGESEVLILQFEEELQSIHNEAVDFASLQQTEILLAILYHLRPILPPTSVISWFDVVLRPALREPKLPTHSVNHAKELIVSALRRTHDTYTQKVNEFRRRLFDLWLLDAFNEASTDDILEWAELQPDERATRTRWKQNLGDTLRKFGNECPQDFLDELHERFNTPSARRQLIDLFLDFMNTPNFTSATKILPQHPFMLDIMHCLLFDNSSTVCTITLSLLSRLLPCLAVSAPDSLRRFLPHFLAILVRIMVWKDRPYVDDEFADEAPADQEFQRELESEANRPLHISPNITWERLEMTFDNGSHQTPHSRSFFTVLYYLYPSNVLKFFRNPVQYLLDAGLKSPYVETWEEAFRPTDEVRRCAENLLREHCSHPLLVWREAVREVSDPEFWRKYTRARIVSESHMLDIRNLAAAVKARVDEREQLSTNMPAKAPTYAVTEPNSPSQIPSTPTHPDDAPPTPSDELGQPESLVSKYVPQKGEPERVPPPTFLTPLDLSEGRISIRLQDMINISLALKSNLNVEVIAPASRWSSRFPELIAASAIEAGASTPSSSVIHDQNSIYVAQAISGLQREVLLLRNDLNFELWLSNENSKHIGRLYQDRILMKTAEAERQGLYNKLRKYRTQVINLERELRDHRQQASSAKNKYADWNTELQMKLKELREEKRKWLLEAAALRSAEKEAQALFSAQGKLLSDAQKRVFDLETQWKENQHKIDRLRDYERQIEQHLKVQRLWDEDFARFNQRSEDVQLMQSQYRQMQIRIEAMEETQVEMDNQCRNYRRQIQTLEAQLKQATELQKPLRRPIEVEIASFSAEKSRLAAENKNLKDEKEELKEEVEELQAMVEVLRGQISYQGLASPTAE